MRLADLKRTHGHLVVVAQSISNVLTICIESYQLGAANTTEELRRQVGGVLADLALPGHLE